MPAEEDYMKKHFNRKYMPAMIGVAIEYYDVSLYGYMAPILVAVFLPNIEKVSAYFYYFAFELLAAIMQIIGAHFFGKMGDAFGRKKAMYTSVIGMCIATFIITILPTFKTAGILAVLLFASSRAMQSFFLAGEYNGAAIYCLEHEPNRKKHGFISGIYGGCLVSGILLAAFVANIINYFGAEYFRIAYAISLILAIIAYKMRANMLETPEYLNIQQKPTLLSPLNMGHWMSAVIAISISIFFGLLYNLPTRIFNAILPLVIDISTNAIMTINTLLLVLYMVLLPIFGFLSDKIGVRKIVISALLGTIIFSFPCIKLISTCAIINIIIAKAIFTVITALFAAPIHAFAQNLFATSKRYRMLSLSNGLGKFISIFILSVTVKLVDYQHNLDYIAYILIISALLLLINFYIHAKRQNILEMKEEKYA